jgi:Cu+-exporting ATPase
MGINAAKSRRDSALRTNAPDAFAGGAGTEKLQVKIGGMACSFCVASITKALGRMDGVRNVNVNLAHEEALVVFEPAIVTPTKLKETLVELGYTVRDAKAVRTFEEEEAELRGERDNLLIGGAYSAVAKPLPTVIWL